MLRYGPYRFTFCRTFVPVTICNQILNCPFSLVCKELFVTVHCLVVYFRPTVVTTMYFILIHLVSISIFLGVFVKVLPLFKLGQYSFTSYVTVPWCPVRHVSRGFAVLLLLNYLPLPRSVDLNRVISIRFPITLFTTMTTTPVSSLSELKPRTSTLH